METPPHQLYNTNKISGGIILFTTKTKEIMTNQFQNQQGNQFQNQNQQPVQNNMQSQDVQFLSVAEFKKYVSGSETTPLQVLKNEKTGKLFVSINGKAFKCQQDISSSKPLSVLVPNGSLEDACLINAEGGATQVFTL